MTMQSPGRHWRLPSSAAARARMLGASILLGSVRQLGRGQRDLHTFISISIVDNVICMQPVRANVQLRVLEHADILTLH